MLVDLHVHTSRYSACGKATGEEMMAMALERGLDAVTITEHNAVWTDDEIKALRAAFPALRIFRGIEVNAAEEEDLLVYGMPNPEALAGRQSISTVVQRVREEGGAVVVAHPLRYRDTIAEALLATPPDACEGWSMNICAFQRPGIRSFQEKAGCGLVAASDAHTADALGIYALSFNADIHDERDLANAIRQRAYTPCQNDRLLAEKEKGLPRLVANVRQALAQGMDAQAIRDTFQCAYSFADHVKAGRYPSLVHEREEDANAGEARNPSV